MGLPRSFSQKFGTGAILPTVITDGPDVLDAAADAILSLRGTAGILGLHIEGPHISRDRKGTHLPEFVRPLDRRTMDVVARLRQEDIRVLITLAPEAVQPGEIRALTDMGAIVSIGHSDATLAETRAAEAEGVSLFTHLFNAMSPMLNRAPGVTGAAITSDAYCSVICDGIHAAPEMLRIAMAARPLPDRMIIVSDAMPTVGGPDVFRLYGQEIRVRDGRLINAEGSLAGAHTTMVASLTYAVRTLGIGLEVALRMAISNPARLLGADAELSVGPEIAVPMLVLDDTLALVEILSA